MTGSSTIQITLDSLYPSFIALAGVVIGALLTYILQQITWSKQKKHEREREKVKLLREKGEELLILLSRWSKAAFLYNMNQLMVVKSEQSDADFMAMAKTIALEPGAHDRMQVLLFLYFPEYEKSWSVVNEKINIGNEAYRQALNGEVDNHSVIQRLKFSSKATETELENIKRNIRSKLVSII